MGTTAGAVVDHHKVKTAQPPGQALFLQAQAPSVERKRKGGRAESLMRRLNGRGGLPTITDWVGIMTSTTQNDTRAGPTACL